MRSGDSGVREWIGQKSGERRQRRSKEERTGEGLGEAIGNTPKFAPKSQISEGGSGLESESGRAEFGGEESNRLESKSDLQEKQIG